MHLASALLTLVSSAALLGQTSLPAVTYSVSSASSTEVGALSVTGGPLTFNYQPGFTIPVPQNLMISSGAAALNWTAAVTPNAGTANCNWLNPGPLSGTTVANSSTTLTIGYNPSALTPGSASYACTIAYSPAASYGAPAADAVPVVVTLNTAPVLFFLVTPSTPQTVSAVYPPSPTTATFNAAVSVIPAPATSVPVTITPFPNNPLNAATTPAPIFTAPASMNLTTTAQSLVVSINPAGLLFGNYQGSFAIASSAFPSTAVITVNLVVVGCTQFQVNPSGAVALTNAVPVSGTPVSATGPISINPGGCSFGGWTAFPTCHG
jgi:hypothetical protein